MATVPSTRRTTPPSPETINWWADGLFLRIPRSAFSHRGFRAWAESDELPEKLRVTFLDGEIYLDMSKEELETHNKVKTEVGRVLLNLDRGRENGMLYSAGPLVSNKTAKMSNNPDAIYLTWESLDSGRVELVPVEGHPGQYVEILGTPDWVMEVVSDNSVRRDTHQLRAAYHRARVPEYWLIDSRGDEIVFQILLWQKRGYVAAPSRDGWQRSRVFGRSFRLVRKPGRRGFWQYTLEVQPA